MRIVKAGIKGRALETSTARVQGLGGRRRVVSRGSLEVSAIEEGVMLGKRDAITEVNVYGVDDEMM